MSYADFSIIKKIKETLNIPVISNGSIATFSDIEYCLNFTKADGVMVSEAILENPAFFSG